MSKIVQVFLDLDGVLVDLERALKEQFGFEFPKQKLPQPEFERISDDIWHKVENKPGFWESLPPTKEWYDLYHHLIGYKPWILSATPHQYPLDSDLHRSVATAKTQWVRTMLGDEQAARTLITKSNMKQMFVSPVATSILIDDMEGNINRWREAGGIGILHETGNLKKTVDAFDHIMRNR